MCKEQPNFRQHNARVLHTSCRALHVHKVTGLRRILSQNVAVFMLTRERVRTYRLVAYLFSAERTCEDGIFIAVMVMLLQKITNSTIDRVQYLIEISCAI
jgi:hypothetical protein